MSSIALRKEGIAPGVRLLMTLFIASGFLALCAQIRIHLPFSPVPFTGQLLGVGLIGAFLGRAKGFWAVCLYLLEGAIGLPFFSGGNAGLLYLFGPVGGYLISFPICAYLIGWIAEEAKPSRTLFLVFAATQVVAGLGTLWLAQFVGFKQAALLGWIPFILFDAIKSYGIAFYIRLWNNKGDGQSRV